MRFLLIACCGVLLLLGCGSDQQKVEVQAPADQPALIAATAPEPLPVPEVKAVTSDSDWVNKAHNKEIEVIEVINIINPVAAYIAQGFKQYGDRFSPTLHEEWEDTQAQLNKALNLYEDCKNRRNAGQVDKQLFLDLEEVWQLLVKTGVAGVRTKSMVDAEAKRVMG